jgi:xylulokinase
MPKSKAAWQGWPPSINRQNARSHDPVSLLLGIDLGTSYFKVGLFDETGQLRGLGRVAVAKAEPQAGFCELAAAEFWRLLREALAQALS